MLNDERRTVEESYTSATNSSNLRCEALRRAVASLPLQNFSTGDDFELTRKNRT